MNTSHETKSANDAEAEFLRHAVDGRSYEALVVLATDPGLTRRSFAVACAAGDVAAVAAALASDPGSAIRPCGSPARAPILWTCFSRVARAEPSRAADLVEVARQLLSNGADPNASVVEGEGAHAWRLSVLYAACCRARNASLAEVLLDAGATPDDGESLYHSTESSDHACVKLLLGRGARIEGTNAVHHMLDRDDLAGLRLFLDAGADPNLRNPAGSLLHWAILRGRSLPIVELLLDRGADARATDHFGLTPHRLAARLGHASAAALLASRGFAEKLSPSETVVAALMRGDLEGARSAAIAEPGLAARVIAGEGELLPEAAWNGQAAAVRALLAFGFPVGSTKRNGETALHCAAWMGRSDIVADLLAAGAPLNGREMTYSATPMGWATHGEQNSRDGDGRRLSEGADHAAVIRLLAAGGAR